MVRDLVVQEGLVEGRAAFSLEEARLERGREGSFRLVGSGCPLADAVAVEPKVCQAVGSLLAGALERRVVARCDRSAAPCCRFEVSSR